MWNINMAEYKICIQLPIYSDERPSKLVYILVMMEWNLGRNTDYHDW
jgi:hypothetical protein